jgi:hypothetical protein
MRTKQEEKEIKDDLEAVSAISAIADQEGGKKLVRGLVTDIVGCVDTLCSKHKTLTMQEFISVCAEMKTKLDMVRVIKRARKNKKYLEELLADTLSE